MTSRFLATSLQVWRVVVSMFKGNFGQRVTRGSGCSGFKKCLNIPCHKILVNELFQWLGLCESFGMIYKEYKGLEMRNLLTFSNVVRVWIELNWSRGFQWWNCADVNFTYCIKATKICRTRVDL